MNKYPLQIGDFVAIEDLLFAWFGVDGLSSSNLIKWEIVGKEVDPPGMTTEPMIIWKLAFVSIATPPVTPIFEDDALESTYDEGGVWQLMISVSRTGVNVTIAKGAAVVVDYDTQSNEFTPGWDAAADEYTVQATGAYDISAGVKFEDIGEIDAVIIRIQVDIPASARSMPPSSRVTGCEGPY